MLRIAIKPFFRIKEIIGKALLEMEVTEGTTVNELLIHLIEAYGPEFERELVDSEKGGIKSSYAILINGKISTQFPEGLHISVKDSDIISIMIISAGG